MTTTTDPNDRWRRFRNLDDVERFNFDLIPEWLYDKQRDAVFHDKTYGIVEASTKAGKTVSHVHWLVGEMLQSAKPEEAVGWWGAPTYDQAQIAFDLMQNRYNEGGLIKETNRSAPASITLGNNAKIVFKSMDRPDTWYGHQVWAGVMDEASRAPNGDEIWKAFISVTTFTRRLGGGRLRVIGNVRGRNNWAYQQARRAESGEAEDWFYASLTAQDAIEANVLTEETIEQARREMSEEEFEELYFNVPRDELLNPFGSDAIRACTMPETWLGEGPAVAYGLDLARKRDYSVCIGLNRFMEVCKVHRSKANWEVQKHELKEFCQFEPVLLDATGLGDVMLSELKNAGVDAQGFVFSFQGKSNLIGRLAVALRDQLVKFPVGQISHELHAYESQETPGGRITYNAPPYEHDDCVIALALAVEQYQEAMSAPLGIVTAAEMERVRQRQEAQKAAALAYPDPNRDVVTSAS